MTGKDFIFSEKRGTRFARHLAFWMICFLYLLYFFYHGGTISWPIEKLILFKATELLLLFLIIIPFSYWVIYKLIPQYFLNKRIFLFILMSILSLLIIGFLLFLNYQLIFNWVHPLFFGYKTNIMHETPVKYLLNPLFGRILPISGIAITLRYLKVIWLKQHEIELLEKAKLSAELKLLKTQVSTDFIFSSLNHITKLSERASPEAPLQVLNLSGLLRYWVYESGENRVPLSQELEIIRNYVSLMTNAEEIQPDCSLQFNGNPQNLMIEPLLLLSMVEASYKRSGSYYADESWITIDLKISEQVLQLRINYSSTGNVESGERMISPEFEAVNKRLQLNYPGSFELRQIQDNDMSMISLKLVLQSLTGLENQNYLADAK
jgi:hypothetical protein